MSFATPKFLVRTTLAKTKHFAPTPLITQIIPAHALTTIFSPVKAVKLIFYAVRILAKIRELAPIL